MPREESSPLLAAASSSPVLAPHAARERHDETRHDARRDQPRCALQRLRLQRRLESQTRTTGGLATAAGAIEEDPAEKWAGLFTPWDASQETAAEDTSLEKIYAVQRDPVNLPPLPQENWGGLFSPWNAEDDSLDKIYAVQSDPVAQVVPHYEVGFEPEEVPQAGVAPWNAIQA